MSATSLGPAYQDHDLVFYDQLGSPIYPSRLGERFLKARKATGIPMGTVHILRHSSATLALTASPPVPLRVRAGRLGDDPKTVLATYAHLLSHSDEMVADALAVIVDKPSTTDAVDGPQNLPNSRQFFAGDAPGPRTAGSRRRRRCSPSRP